MSVSPQFRRVVCVCANPAIDRIAAVDHLVAGAIHRPEMLSVLPGGKALNVARAALLLGVPATAVVLLGGHAGDWIADRLADGGILARRVAVTSESRTCLSILDRATGELTEFYEPGATIDAAAWERLEAALAAEIRPDPAGSIVVISSSPPPGSPADGYRRLAAIAALAGSAAVVDVGGAQLAAALAARPWLVKVNAAEAAAATGIPATGEAAAARAAAAMHDAGCEAAIVTRGVDGAIVAAASGTWRVGSSTERGRFAVGSGDAFLAGLLAGVIEGLDLPEAARRGAAVGVANALVPGQGEFRSADVERILPSIGLDRLG